MKATGILTFAYCLWLGAASPLWAIPNYDRTTLPIPETMDGSEQHMLKEILKLEVYQDTKDPNKYYYVPPFRLRQYSRGAASMMLHAHNVRQYAAIQKELDARATYADEYSQEKIERLYERVEDDQDDVNEAEAKLAEALERGNRRIIEIYEAQLAREIEFLRASQEQLKESEKIIREGGTLLPPGLGRAYFERALIRFAEAGASLPYSGGEEPALLTRILEKALHDLSQSYGGFLSVNAYAGFSEAELDALSAYKRKYLPNITISLLPIEKLTFFPLTEWQHQNRDEPRTSQLFRQVNGSGDYLGAAIVMDVSIAGSYGLAAHMAPFVVPVGVKATFKEMQPPTEAELHCDFTTGYSVRGRADIRDGLVIFDNDINNAIKAYDNSEGACDLKLISGDQDSAYFASLRHLETVFDDLQIKRTLLAEKEKKAYYNGVLADLEENRREREPRYSNILRRFTSLGWQTVVIEGLTRAADFHWHTNQQDIENISTVQFTKRISIAGHKVIERDLATNFCLVYNMAMGAYDRCAPADDAVADTMLDSIEQANNSPECSNVADPFLCGESRDRARIPAELAG